MSAVVVPLRVPRVLGDTAAETVRGIVLITATYAVMALGDVAVKFALPMTGLAAAILFRGKRDLAPWTVAIAAAFTAKWAIAGNWYIVIGGLAGGLFGALQDLRKKR